MSHPLHHSISSQKKWGGHVDDYLPIHNWFDATRVYYCDMRHRSMRHHIEGFTWCEKVFGKTIINSEGFTVPVRAIGEQHCNEDVGFIPTIYDYLRHIHLKSWMLEVSREKPKDPNENSEKTNLYCLQTLNRWGGQPEDYIAIHQWFDESWEFYPDVRCFALRHHVQGILWCEQTFGDYIINSDNRMIPVRAIGEGHCKDAVGSIPTIQDYLENMAIVDWMYNPGESRNVMKAIRQNKWDYIK